MDIVYLHGLEVRCVIGVWEWERRFRQKLVIDLDMAADVAGAAASDRLDDTLDYKKIAKRVTAFVTASEFRLVETVAERVAELLMTEFAMPWVRVRVDKGGAVRGARNVGVMIERGVKS
jgi:7,8-dihydroneopterin aldolase/epimerase/oxygenase